MLRPKKFRPFELKILSALALLLVTASVAGTVLAIQRADWRLLLASLGLAGVASLYCFAAKRGKPL